ncbi:MAG: TnpV protein, partial [Faecousia sp.]
NSLILSEKLYPHLREIDETANSRLERMMPELMQSAGVTEALKASDPMKWVGLMNSLKAQAEEVILTELIYA